MDKFVIESPLGQITLTLNNLEKCLIERIVQPDTPNLQINISESSKRHKNMCYTTTLDTLKLILKNRTIRSSSLTNVALNDLTEPERLGVEELANGKFIICFSYITHESIPFWMNYANPDKSKKIFLRFKNFARDFENLINTDYCLTKDDQKLFFASDDFKHTINTNGLPGQRVGLSPINLDYDQKNCVKSIEIFDVKYYDCKNRIFSDYYLKNLDVIYKNSIIDKEVPTQFPDALGREKSNPWDYEKESRVLLNLLDLKDKRFDYIDLQLKDNFFKNMEIIKSPWESEGIHDEILKAIAKSPISPDIKSTFKIRESGIKGTLNL